MRPPPHHGKGPWEITLLWILCAALIVAGLVRGLLAKVVRAFVMVGLFVAALLI